MPRSKVELFAATRQGLASPPPHPIDAEPAETAAVSRDQRQDVFGSRSPRASGTVRRTGEVAAEKILVPWTPTVARRTLPGIG